MAVTAIVALFALGCVSPALGGYSTACSSGYIWTGARLGCKQVLYSQQVVYSGVISQPCGATIVCARPPCPVVPCSVPYSTPIGPCGPCAVGCLTSQCPSCCSGYGATATVVGCTPVVVYSTVQATCVVTVPAGGAAGAASTTITTTVTEFGDAVTVTAAEIGYEEAVTWTSTVMAATTSTATVTSTSHDMTVISATETVSETEISLVTTTFTQTEYMTSAITSVSTYTSTYPTTIVSAVFVDDTTTVTYTQTEVTTVADYRTEYITNTATDWVYRTEMATSTTVVTSIAMETRTEIAMQTQFVTTTIIERAMEYRTATYTAAIPSRVDITQTQIVTVSSPSNCVTVLATQVRSMCVPQCYGGGTIVGTIGGIAVAPVAAAVQPCIGVGCSSAVVPCVGSKCTTVQLTNPCVGSGCVTAVNPCTGYNCILYSYQK